MLPTPARSFPHRRRAEPHPQGMHCYANPCAPLHNAPLSSTHLALLLLALCATAGDCHMQPRSHGIKPRPQLISAPLPRADGRGSYNTFLRGGATNGGTLKAQNGCVPLIAGTYMALGLTAMVVLLSTAYKHPLWPFQMDSLIWCRAWLLTTIGDYYGACFSLCAVILASEPRWQGIAWSLGCCLLGAPVCSFWVVSRVLRKGTISLRD